jgi:hypothetical protein
MASLDKPEQFTDDDFLALVSEERRQSLGFENDDTLVANRERALDYFKGEMPDMPSLPNRSKAVSTDVADAVETLMPDLMEVFTGEDVATFTPHGEEDVEAAEQETDYVNHVLFNENRGWLVLYSKIKDALLCKIGVAKVYAETWDETGEEHFQAKTQLELFLAEQDARAQGAEITDLIAAEPDPITGEPLWNFTVRHTAPRGKVCVVSVPPEDFAVARDTVIIGDATYCAMRTRLRAQDLVAQGYDPQIVAELPPYATSTSDADRIARDTAGENSMGTPITSSELYGLHQVEIIEHYIRVDADGDGKPELWCVVTGGDESTLLKREQVDRIPFAVSTPYIVTHRLFGLSLFDKLAEVQRIRTALLRLMLDSGYFAMNQRYEVAIEKMSKSTLSDLLNNIPGSPILSKSGDAVRAVGGGRLDFDVAGALEYAATLGEARSGIVRNAQGLNPDTLHDTAKGAMVLISAAQKRIRMIARVFAETGIKDLFLLVHAAIRSLPSQDNIVRLRGKWVPVDPTQWGERNDLTIEVGIGSGGRDQQLAALQLVMNAQQQAVTLQGGANGPLVDMGNLYSSAKKLLDLSGLRGADKYVTDPAPFLAQQQQQGPPTPPPDPKLVQVQTEAETERYRIDQENMIKKYQIDSEIELRRQQIALDAHQKVLGIAAPSDAVKLGGMAG